MIRTAQETVQGAPETKRLRCTSSPKVYSPQKLWTCLLHGKGCVRAWKEWAGDVDGKGGRRGRWFALTPSTQPWVCALALNTQASSLKDLRKHAGSCSDPDIQTWTKQSRLQNHRVCPHERFLPRKISPQRRKNSPTTDFSRKLVACCHTGG